MASGIIYLDIDDEITSAAARVRSSDARRVALVLPHGSRVATSRINFRLLSRDALINEKQLAVVAGDPATRALAASAGLPVFGSVGEYESSFAGLEVEPAADDARAAMPARPAATPVAAPANIPSQPQQSSKIDPTAPLPPWRPENPTRSAAGAGAPNSPVKPAFVSSGRRSIARLPVIVALAVLGLIVLVGGVGAYVLLPSATIVVSPRPEALPPLVLTVTADPAVTAPNAESLVVPAVKVPLDVMVTDTFPATGKRVEETRASGQVRFSNLDFLRTNTVPGGSIVSTNAGVRFRTNSTITVPRADLVGLTVFPGRATVGVTAVQPGIAANVEPNTIVIVPKGEDPQALKVVNPDATTGGTHDEFPKVVQADVTAALKKLSAALDAAFQTRLDDPSIAAPGATVFRETAVRGDATPSIDPATLVDQEIAAFQLGLSATGTVISVDPSPISALAEQKFRASVTAGHELVAGSINVTVGAASVSGQVVSFPATAAGQQIAELDPAALKALVLGKSLDDARAALAAYGDARVTTWPDWVGSIPTIDSRVSLTIQSSVPLETPGPSDAPS